MPPTRPAAAPRGWTAISPSRSARARSRRCSHPWKCKRRNEVATASVADADRGPTPSIIDAGFYDVELLLDGGVEEEGARGIRELEVAGAQVHVIVFDLRGPVVVKGVFDAGADHPAPLGLAAVEGRQQRGVRRRQTVFVARPGAAALAVEEVAIEGDAQPGRDRADALDLDLAVRRRKRAIDQRGRRAGAAAGEICAADIRLRAEYEGTDLVVASDLAAAEPSADVD